MVSEAELLQRRRVLVSSVIARILTDFYQWKLIAAEEWATGQTEVTFTTGQELLAVTFAIKGGGS